MYCLIDATFFISPQDGEIRAPRGIFQLRSVNVDASPDTSSDRSFLWAKNQIESHQDCCQPKTIDRAFVPTRLINVGSIGPDRDVVLEENTPRGSRYVALSYCWGSDAETDNIDQINKTTSATFPDYKKRISWDRIPQTIQHAVTFTRRLGIKYLWVDRFCIIQGDKDDWKEESKRMFNVYRHSYVTLAAVWGQDCNSGLFSKAEDFKSLLLSYLYLNGQCWPLYMRRYHHPYVRWLGGEYETLFTRGWTYQERLIAPRVLHFRKDEMELVCFCRAACECCITQYQVSIDTSRFYRYQFYEDVIRRKENLTARDLESHSNIGNFPNERWRRIVCEYSRLNLTDSNDKLAAIQAVADQFKALDIEQQYLSGLWSGSLHKDLLWYPIHLQARRGPVKRNNEMPTWSWASIADRGVKFTTLGDGVTHSAEFINGTSEELRMRGRLLRCWLVEKINTNGLEEEYLSLTGRLGYKTSLTGSNFMKIETTGLSGGSTRQKVYLFEVARRDFYHDEDIYFLVLRRKDNPNEFVRVGYFYMRCNRDWRWGWSLHDLRRMRNDMWKIQGKARLEYMKAVIKILGRTEEIKLK